MRRLNHIALLLACGWAGLTTGPLRADTPITAMPVDRYAALVNTRVITAGEVLSIVQPMEQQLRTMYEGRELEAKVGELYEQTLDTLIERALILEEFKTMGGALPDRAVEDYVNSIIHDRFDGNRADFLSALAEERLTLSDWREEMKERLIVSIMRRQEVNDRILISPGEVRRAYDRALEKYKHPEEVRLSMIVIHQGETEADKLAKREQAERILARLKEGGEFAAVAKETSEGAKAAQGGDLGWLEPSSLRKELGSVVKGLKLLEITPVIEAGDDYYILKLEGRKKASVTPYEQVRGEIEEELREIEGQRLYQAWIARLRKKHYVKVFTSSP